MDKTGRTLAPLLPPPACAPASCSQAPLPPTVVAGNTAAAAVVVIVRSRYRIGISFAAAAAAAILVVNGVFQPLPAGVIFWICLRESSKIQVETCQLDKKCDAPNGRQAVKPGEENVGREAHELGRDTGGWRRELDDNSARRWIVDV